MNSESGHPISWFVLAICLMGWSVAAQVPGIISHQGKLTVNGTNFTGTCQFKFALVNAAGDTTWWSHNGTSIGGSEPSGTAVSLPVTRGVFSVNLGDINVANMTQPIPAVVFTHDSVWLRIWVNDGVNGSQRLVPDRRITAAGYALVAGSALAPAASATNFSGPLAGDVTGAQAATVVSTVGGVSAASVANGANAANAATAVWAGDRFLVWGGTGELGELNTGGQLLFSGGVPTLWQTMSSTDAPSARRGHTAVWNGERLLIWGGDCSGTVFGDGGAYSAQGDTWMDISSTNAPAARTDHAAVWAGSEMLIVAGAAATGELSTGAAYDPATEQWRSLSNSGGPLARKQTVAVWTGAEIMVYGGLSAGQRVGGLQRLVPQPTWYFYRKL